MRRPQSIRTSLRELGTAGLILTIAIGTSLREVGLRETVRRVLAPMPSESADK